MTSKSRSNTQVWLLVGSVADVLLLPSSTAPPTTCDLPDVVEDCL